MICFFLKAGVLPAFFLPENAVLYLMPARIRLAPGCRGRFEIQEGGCMYEFLEAFWDFFFSPLYSMDLDNDLYVLIYLVLICYAVWWFVRRVFQCFGSM